MTDKQKAEIMHKLDHSKRGDLILNPTACADWIPTQDDDAAATPAEAWTTAFNEIIIGTEYGTAKTMTKKVLAEYFEGLKEYQLHFWRFHADKIKATIDGDLLNEYD